MFGIIWFVVVLYIVIRCVNNAKKNGRTKPNVPGKPAQSARQKMYETGGKWTSPKPQAQKVPQQSKRGSTADSGRSARPIQPKKEAESIILQRAKANAAKQFDVDELEARGKAVLDRVPRGDEIVRDKAKDSHIHSAHKMNSHDADLHNEPGIDDFDTYHLIDEVNDLIVMGYSGNMEFERDFLAEAMDMLNRISS